MPMPEKTIPMSFEEWTRDGLPDTDPKALAQAAWLDGQEAMRERAAELMRCGCRQHGDRSCRSLHACCEDNVDGIRALKPE